jgi:hypothetical protein
MRWKWFNAAALVSTLMLVGTVGLWVCSFALDPHEHHLTVNPSFHIGLSAWRAGSLPGRLVFFSDPEYGPYRGSIIWISGDGSPEPIIERHWWSDAPGVYYRHFRWPDSSDTLWTLAVSLAYPALLFAVFPAIWVYRRRRCRAASPDG